MEANVSVSGGKLILVIDDDRDLAEMLRLALTYEGYRVVVANEGRDGLRQFYQIKPNLVIVDIMMPGMDGWVVCERIRELSDAPMMILTARTDESEVTRGLYLGADDYITKPFSMSEFLARVKAVLRRSQESQRMPTQSFLTIDSRLSIDLTKRRVIVHGRPVQALSPTELRLLSVLVARAGEVVPFEVLLEQVWGLGTSKSTDHLKTYIHYLRNKIEENPARPKYIVTERGLGYRLQIKN